MLRALRFLETLIQRDDAQKVAFLKDLAQLWPQCDSRILRCCLRLFLSLPWFQVFDFRLPWERSTEAVLVSHRRWPSEGPGPAVAPVRQPQPQALFPCPCHTWMEADCMPYLSSACLTETLMLQAARACSSLWRLDFILASVQRLHSCLCAPAASSGASQHVAGHSRMQRSRLLLLAVCHSRWISASPA